MFEGQVTENGLGWIPWIRPLAPDELPGIAEDLVHLRRELGDAAGLGTDADYVLHFLQRAVDFVTQAASSGRGLVYTIG